MTIMVSDYVSKKALKEQIGQSLSYEETSFHGPEYKANGSFVVTHRPSISRAPGREFSAVVTMKNDLIVAVV